MRASHPPGERVWIFTSLVSVPIRDIRGFNFISQMNDENSKWTCLEKVDAESGRVVS
jgi:hypothetical protein